MVVIVVLVVSIIFAGLVHNAFVQTYLARVAAIHLSEYLDAKVKIDKLRISSFFTLNAEGIEINDLQNEPMIHLKSIYLSTDFFNAIKSDLDIDRLTIDSASIFFRRYAGIDELNIVRLLNRFRRDGKVESDTMLQIYADFKLKIDRLDLKNSRFIYQIEEKIGPPTFGMDFVDLDIQNIEARFRNISIYNDSINVEIKQLSAFEKSGFQLNNLEGKAVIFKQGLQLYQANFETPSSNLTFDLDFEYPNWGSFNNYVDEVNMRVEVYSGGLFTSDIAFFAPAMEGMDNLIKLSGSFNGPVRNLRARNLAFSFGEETQFMGNVQMTGLPKILETFISLRVLDFSTSLTDIQQFKLPYGKVIGQIPEILASFGTIRIKGNFTGFYNDFVSNANFQTNIGQLTTDIQFSNNPNRDIIEYRGDFKALQFDLGSFLKREEYFGKLDFDLQVKGEGMDMESINANVIGKINSFQFKGNQLNDIAINGLFQEQQFTGDFSINDALIKADFQGHVKFDTLTPVFDFNLKLAHTHLAMLGLLPVDSSAVFASNINLNFSGNSFDKIRGEIRLDSTNLLYKNDKYVMQNLQINTFSNAANNKTIRLKSDFVDGNVDGEFLLSEMKNTAILFLHKFLPNSFYSLDIDTVLYTKNINWDIRFKDLSNILPLFIKPLQISKNSRWTGRFDAEKNLISSQVNMQRASYDGVRLSNLQLKIFNIDQALNADLTADALVFKEEQKEDTLRLGVDNLRFSSLAKNDSIQFLFNWKNKFEAIKNKGDIQGFVSLSQTPNIDIKLEKADLIINDTNWFIHPENKFRISENGLLFEKVGFFSGSQLVEFTGGFDQQNEQAFMIKFNNFDVSNFDILLSSSRIDLDGQIDGDLQFVNIKKNIDFLANLQVNDFKINKEMIGDIALNSKRNIDKSIFINAEIVKTLDDNQIIKPLVFEGYYYPDKYENSLDFSLLINQLPFNVASPFLYKWVDRLDGNTTGNVQIGGRLGKPDIKGTVHLDKVGFRILYLNTDYKLTANAVIDNYFIDLRDADLRDLMNNRAMVYGGLFHNHLKGFGVDISILPQNFMGLNTRKGMNSMYYGKAFASGSVDISGPFDDIDMNIKIEANRGSDVVIPINLVADVSNNDFITFISRLDTLAENLKKKPINELSGFSLNMDLSLNPSARVEIILPEDLGNIQGVGYGDLNLNLTQDGNFTMAGDYQVTDGTFLFTIKNVYKKRFDLVNGGTISWTGDPYAGELNMKAIYHVRTSLSTLGSSQEVPIRTRVPIDCVIGLSDQILNPTVKFGFEFPNSPEEIRQIVFNQIDTTNEAVMAQQMLSLLVLNSFSFSSATGNEDFASNVGGTSLQLVGDQVSNWLSQISKDWDVGIKYRPGGTITNEEVEVALSTQLFDERITIEGNFGYQNLDNMTTSNTSNIVGDISVGAKITKDGRLRLKAFNLTNTVDLYDNIAPYTQGLGIFYRKEFNFFKDLFRRINKEEEEKEEEISEPQNSTTDTIPENVSKIRRPIIQKSIPPI